MSFRLLGVKVRIQMSFWVTAVLLGLASVRRLADHPEVSRGWAVGIFVGVVLVAVLVHELGHALVMRRYGYEPEITLYALGGLTHARAALPLGRRAEALISLAGPFAGFVLGGLGVAAYFLTRRFHGELTPLQNFTITQLCWVNFGWGIINLMPVLPLDGGHVLAAALGPKRAQLTAAISTLVGFLVAALCVQRGLVWGALIFGLAAIQSYRRFVIAGNGGAVPGEPAPPDAPERPELTALLRMAQRALGDEELERAALLAQRVLEGEGDLPPGPRVRRQALEVIAWTHLLGGHADTAADVLAEVRPHRARRTRPSRAPCSSPAATWSGRGGCWRRRAPRATTGSRSSARWCRPSSRKTTSGPRRGWRSRWSTRSPTTTPAAWPTSPARTALSLSVGSFTRPSSSA